MTTTEGTSSGLATFAQPLIVAVAITLFYLPLLNPATTLTGADFFNHFWALKEFRLRALADHGIIPLWNPFNWMGTPLAATLQHAVFYPVDYLFFSRSPVLYSMKLYVLAHIIFAGIGMWWWARKGFQFGAAAALFVGITFPCTAWFWGTVSHINRMGTLSYLPWVVGSMHLFLAGRTTGRQFVVMYSGFSVLQFLVGHPQAAFYTHFAAACGILFFLLKNLGQAKELVIRWIGPFFATAFITGLGVAVLLLPALELKGLSYRSLKDFDPTFPLSFSMPPEMLKRYVAPNAFGSFEAGFGDRRNYTEYHLFVGWLTLILAAVGAVFLLKKRRWSLVAFFALGLVGVGVLCLGGNGSLGRLFPLDFTEHPSPALSGLDPEHTGLLYLSLYEVVSFAIPPLQGFRVPARFSILLNLGWVMLAGFGVQAIVLTLREKKPNFKHAELTTGTVVAALSFVTLLVPSSGEKFRHMQPWRDYDILFPSTLEIPQDEHLGHRIFRLTTSDHGYVMKDQSLEEMSELSLLVGGLPTSVIRLQRLMENTNAALGIPSIEGYEEGIAPTIRIKDFVFEFNRHFRRADPDPALLSLLGVQYVWADLPVDSDIYEPMRKWDRFIVYRNPKQASAAHWVAELEGIDLARLDGPHARTGDLPHRGRRREMVDYGSAPEAFVENTTLTAHLLTPHKIEIRSSGQVQGEAILATAAFPGWKIGAEPAEFHNAVHMKVPESAFDADGVALASYEPDSFRFGLFLSSMGLTIWCLLLPGAMKRERVTQDGRFAP